FKFYTGYALRTPDGQKYYERFEDRVALTAIAFSEDEDHAMGIIQEIMTGRFQPATPTFLNGGRTNSGDPVSCFLLRIEDNMESISRAITDSLQLSKRGGGVGLLLTNIREAGAPIKKFEDQASGLIPVMKLFEDSFSYANQLGQRQGAGVVYLNAHHPDIMAFLDTKRENADEKIRIKTLSLGVVIPDITFELAKNNEDMYLFSPYDVERVYGKAFADISVSEKYREMVDNPRIRKTKINARQFFTTIAQIQFESGYPYIMFDDAVNDSNVAPNIGRITHSNLCVAPETRVLTDKGYLPIGDLAGQTVNAWNGERFSPSLVAKTGENQELITITFSNGGSLDVTPYHKFYVKNDYDKPAVEVSAAELVEGDRLEKFELDVIDAPAKDFPRAYTAGLHTAEGTYGRNGSPILRLYPGKLHLGESIEYKSSSLKEDAGGRVSYTLYDDTPRKFHVPTDYSLRSRLEWLAGVIDGDGYGNGAVGIQIASIHADFLEEVRILLTTLGVHSKWAKHKDAGSTQFRESEKFYDTKEIYRLVISGSEAQKLRKLGLPTKRVIIGEYEHQRSAREFVKVTSVVATGRIDDTYCLNEPDRHKVVFEGIQTGNCSEIAQPFQPSTFNESGSFRKVGMDVACNLGSLNVARVSKLDGPDLGRCVSVAYRFLNRVAEVTEINSSPSVRRGNNGSRAIGLGQMGLHGALIERGIDYESEEARVFWDTYMAEITYLIISESMLKAWHTNTVFEGFEGSRWQDGTMLNRIRNHYKRIDMDKREPYTRLHLTADDWIALNFAVEEHGLYNRNLQAIPPTGSISYINNATASIHPITALVEIRKEGKTGRIYYPAYGLNNDNMRKIKTAYEIGPNPVIDMYAVSTPYIDQAQSLTLFFPDTATTRDINKAQIYAHQQGIKTIYYIRMMQKALAGTEIEECVSCML
ncbi:MAG: LAGLIDADG family homing endonuclease, partial [Alphaproteobacteria bacterium]|nr:LAGLIDADG family homing endonuclease [Alphaproteobacteria bacterium]